LPTFEKHREVRPDAITNVRHEEIDAVQTAQRGDFRSHDENRVHRYSHLLRRAASGEITGEVAPRPPR
jgi:hypothetical protein